MSNRLGPLQYGIIVLTIITALIHLGLGVTFLPDFFGILFLLNGITYLLLLAGLYFIPQLANRRSLIRWLLLAFTALTFVLYFAFNWPDIWGLGGIVDKTVELILIVLLLIDIRN
ncbi:MAG: hypothetical protein R3293_16460 [Candidatus Promineifilaceae bacterium]|nr:hypothetical protein [Candidatus Promineifilaceae bacterium]